MEFFLKSSKFFFIKNWKILFHLYFRVYFNLVLHLSGIPTEDAFGKILIRVFHKKKYVMLDFWLKVEFPDEEDEEKNSDDDSESEAEITPVGKTGK